ncbi:hypothetical protein JCM8097_006491 [Rhodosporidiobolus ruineniae]
MQPSDASPRLPSSSRPAPPPSTKAALPPLPPPPAAIAALLARHHFSRASFSLGEQEGARGNVYLDLAGQHLQAAGRGGGSDEEEDEGEWEDELPAPSYARKGDTSELDDGQEGRLVLLAQHPAFVVAEVKSHAGVLVARRRRRGDPAGEEDVFLERMPLATRIGMRLLYHGLQRGKLLRSREVEKAFKQWSVREGKKFDSPHNALHRIEAFVRAYNIDTTSLLEPDLTLYPTLNSFFCRKLRPDARPLASPNDATVISSAADCRLTVFRSVDEAKRLWIKGRHFTLPSLLQDPSLAASLAGGPVAIFRLAPADYHRFHAPVACVVGETKHVPGAYFTVNSMIVRDKRFDVFTSNKRDGALPPLFFPPLSLLFPPAKSRPSTPSSPRSRQPVDFAFVQVGALLVASIRQTKKAGRAVKRGEELGYFAYGGSTVIAIFPPGTVEWDEDLLRNSEGRNAEGVQLETLVKVGEQIGRWV